MGESNSNGKQDFQDPWSGKSIGEEKDPLNLDKVSIAEDSPLIEGELKPPAADSIPPAELNSEPPTVDSIPPAEQKIEFSIDKTLIPQIVTSYKNPIKAAKKKSPIKNSTITKRITNTKFVLQLIAAIFCLYLIRIFFLIF